MLIYRPINKIYRCINSEKDLRRYVLVEKEGCYPTLVFIKKASTKDGGTAYENLENQAVPILNFNEKQSTI